MTKLPVLYLSCETQALTGPRGQSSLRRLIQEDLRVDSVAFITSDSGAGHPEIFRQCGKGMLARRLQSLMQHRGFEVSISGPQGPELKMLAESMTQLLPEEVIELRLNTGMTSERYRDIGLCLETLRDQGVLLICLDRMESDDSAASHHQPHDVYIRKLIQQWEDEQRWVKAMSGVSIAKGAANSGRSVPVADPTLCVLNTAFSLGGMKVPQRLFGFSLDEDSESLAGYGWMH
ncbi:MULTISPECIES: hypothetical protein [Marinobacter]|uniref:hypothetical protein n=1 Tax=Marinobacter TaxID=2742 RepID=UPI0012460D2D|nr:MULTISPECIES: hypothetical protein [Marinobacter]MBL3556396.1 hypothetical protein [Marinobacter sp. JB05H06]